MLSWANSISHYSFMNKIRIIAYYQFIVLIQNLYLLSIVSNPPNIYISYVLFHICFIYIYLNQSNYLIFSSGYQWFHKSVDRRMLMAFLTLSIFFLLVYIYEIFSHSLKKKGFLWWFLLNTVVLNFVFRYSIHLNFVKKFKIKINKIKFCINEKNRSRIFFS